MSQHAGASPASVSGAGPDPVDPLSLRLHAVDSKILGERRPYRVLLPPGYADSPDRRYPVLYLHDGQAAFEADTRVLSELLGGRWPALDPGGRGITEMMRRGAVQAFITVAVDALSLDGRIRDFLPPGDGHCGVAGAADRYARFVIEELKPLVDVSCRTRPDRESTATAGFSFGGVVSFFMGWDHAAWFGSVGSMSGAFWLPRFLARVRNEGPRDVRVYIDSGEDNREANVALRDALLAKSYVLERNLRYLYREQQEHLPEHFATRLAPMLTFLFPPASRSLRVNDPPGSRPLP